VNTKLRKCLQRGGQDGLLFALTACERLPFSSPRPVPYILSFS
jgi:hypothetical protein